MNDGDSIPYHLRPGAPQRRVVCAANRIASGEMALGPRHFHALMHVAIQAMIHSGSGSRAEWTQSEQGFIDQWGTFMTREEALAVALAAGQRLYRCGGDETRLFSENLY